MTDLVDRSPGELQLHRLALASPITGGTSTMTDINYRAPLEAHEIRYDQVRITWHGKHGTLGAVVEVDAAAESTRYHMLFVQTHGGWWIQCENLSEPWSTPILPHIDGWHWSYFAGFGKYTNPRSAMAFAHIANHVHQRVLDDIGV